MTGMLALLALGFLLGMRHATDPDHLIAVTTIVTRERTPAGATAIGAAWGLGHTLTILLVGGGIILFGWVIPPRIGLAMEFAVGLMLVLLGLLNLSGGVRRSGARDPAPNAERPHRHAHAHGDFVHSHVHGHEPESHPHRSNRTPLRWIDRQLHGFLAYRLLRPLVVGVVHGLAGSAAVALLVLTTIRSPRWALWYLLVFGLGTVLGMMLLTAVIALPFTRGTHRVGNLGGRLRIASGFVSLGFGMFVAYRIGFVDGLFSASPHWTPH